MIELKFIGSAADVHADMLALLGGPNVINNTFRNDPQESPKAQPGTPPENAASLQSLAGDTATGKPRGRGRPRSAPQTIEGEVTSKTEAPAQNISTSPENRTDPETAAQDKADEAASEEKPGAKVYTIDDVRDSAGAYVKKWGMDAASVDLVPCMMKAVGVGRMSELDALKDPAKFEAAVKAIDAAVAAEARYPTEG